MTGVLQRLWGGRRITTVVTVSVAVIILAVISVITVWDISRQRAIFEKQLEETGLTVSRTLNDVLANPLYFRDIDRLRRLSDVAKAQPEILSLTVFSPDGHILIAPGSEKFPAGSVSEDIVSLVVDRAESEFRFLDTHAELLTPVVVSDDVIGGLRFEFDNANLLRQNRATIIQHIWQGGLVMLLGIGLSYMFAQSIVRPVREMIGVTDRIADGDFEISVEQERADEIGELARSLQAMTRRLQEAERQQAEQQNVRLRDANRRLQIEVAERKRAQLESEQVSKDLERALRELRETQDKVVRHERLSAVGQMSSGIAHDINNRLQMIQGLSDRLLLEPDHRFGGADARKKLELIRESVQDAAEVVALLRDFYQPMKKSESFERIDVAAVIEAAKQMTEPRWKDQAQRRGIDLTVTSEVAELPFVDGSASELREALINLIFNAVDALPAGGVITVRGRVEAEDIVVEVVDSGVGMSEEVRQRCLEPFFTTKGEGGSGLGLAMIYRTVRRHEGKLEIDSSVGRGTTMRIRLPLTPVADAAKPPAGAPTTAEPLDILIVDDEPLVRKLLATLLTHDGHRIVTAEDGSDGLEKFRAGRFDLVIVDRAMPGMNGDELAAHIKRIAPQTPVVMLTGFGDMMNATDDIPAGVDLTLGKPIRHSALSEAIANVVEAVAAKRINHDAAS